jgi:hypothetical protein
MGSTRWIAGAALAGGLAVSLASAQTGRGAWWLQGANLNDPLYKVGWRTAAARATGVDDHLSRRVVITVRPR